jgi:hypothetical protein
MAEADLIAPTAFRPAVQKPKFGIYYALLIIALCAMIVACIYLYMFINAFGGFGTVKGQVAVSERPGILFHHGVHGEHRGETISLSSVSSVHSVVNS